MKQIARVAISVLLFVGPVAAAETWLGGSLQFDVPESLAAGRTVEPMPNGQKAQIFEEKLDGGTCRIKLAPPLLVSKLESATQDGSLSPQGIELARKTTQFLRSLVDADETTLNQALHAMVIPAIDDLSKHHGYKQVLFVQEEPSFTEHDLQLGTVSYVGKNDAGSGAIWGIAAFVDLGVYLTVIEAPEPARSACAERMEALVASYRPGS